MERSDLWNRLHIMTGGKEEALPFPTAHAIWKCFLNLGALKAAVELVVPSQSPPLVDPLDILVVFPLSFSLRLLTYSLQ